MFETLACSAALLGPSSGPSMFGLRTDHVTKIGTQHRNTDVILKRTAKRKQVRSKCRKLQDTLSSSVSAQSHFQLLTTITHRNDRLTMLARAFRSAVPENVRLCRALGGVFDSSSISCSSIDACSRSGWPVAVQHPAAPAAAPAATAAAAGCWLQQRRSIVAAAASRRGATEDFDLIAPDQGLARIEG